MFGNSSKAASTAVVTPWTQTVSLAEAALESGETLEDAKGYIEQLEGYVSKGDTKPLGKTRAQETVRSLKLRWNEKLEMSRGRGKISKHAIVSAQKNVREEQESSLDELSSQLSRVGQIGRGIHEEVDMQSRLLDDLEQGVGQGREGMGGANRAAEGLVEAGGTCKLWTAIVALTIVLILLIVLG